MKIRFRPGILSGILFLLLLSSIMIWAAGDWSARKTADSLSLSIMNRAGMSVAERLELHLNPAMNTVFMIASLMENSVINMDDPESFAELLENFALKLNIDRIYAASHRGDFFMAAVQPDSTVRHRIVLPKQDLQYWSWVDDKGVQHVDKEPVSYDPRSREWFSMAKEKGAGWTDVYRFQSDNQPGITVAASVFLEESGCKPCVIGADLTLAELSAFLSGISVTENSVAFLLDNSGHIIAHPDTKLIYPGGESLSKAIESTDTLVRNIGLHLMDKLVNIQEASSNREFPTKDPKQKETIFSSTGDRGPTKVMLLHYSHEELLPAFNIAIAIPESDLLQPLHRARLLSALIAFFSIFLGVFFAIILSRGLARPILQLEKSMRKVGDFNLDLDRDIKTVYIELQDMVHSFDRMVSGLESFSKYVPRDIVRDLVATGKKAEAGGEERLISMFFSDIQGFTALCETMKAQAIVSQLSEYLETVVDTLKAQGATIDKFIGDAVMALWNAPRYNPDHSLAAALGAIEVISAAQKLNEKWAGENRPQLYTRIGISTARVVVGNIGSKHRLSYTALGDGVNLTARLESSNKTYSTQIIASESLVSRLPPNIVAAQPLDLIIVKGKQERIRIFEILGKKDEIDPSRLEAADIYSDAFEMYLAGNFESAEKRFSEISACLPGYKPAEILLKRCRILQKTTPVEWDGIFLNEKGLSETK